MAFLTSWLFARPTSRSNKRRRFGSSAIRQRPSRWSHFDAAAEVLEIRSLLTAGWVTAISGPSNENIADLAGNAAGNTYVTGKFGSQQSMFGSIALTGDGLGDIFVAKQNANGQYLWATKAGNPSSGNDQGLGVATDAAGNVFITGYFEGTAQFGTQTLTSAGGYDVFIAKLDGNNGQFLWAQQRGGSGYDQGKAITIDSNGNVLVSGGSNAVSGSDAPVVFVSKFTTDGTELWSSTATGAMTGTLFSIAVDGAGDVYAAGRFNGTAEFSTGTLVSTASLAPVVYSNSSNALITKLDRDGHWLWARQVAGDTSGLVRGATIGPDGQLYVSGQFEGTINFDSNSLTSFGSTDGFVARVSAATGSVDWARRVGGRELDLVPDIKVDPQGNIVAVGTFRDTADFGPEMLTTDGGVENAFMTKLNSSGTFLETHRLVTGTFSGNMNIVVPVAGLSIDSAGNLYIGGWFAGGTVQFPQQSLSGNYSTGYVVRLPSSAATKFFVVDDSYSDRTYQYAASGNLTIDNFTFNSGNLSPRGAASNAAGTKVWVADANRNVYVYSASGAQLGAWTAGTLQSTAQVEGMTTNGTDVWIVDNTTDKVFKYTAAAGLLSGSLNSSSSFKLNSGNSNAKGIVTDGTSIWVVNDSTTDKVFKYSLSGALLGSWTIDAANSSPTGLTIDPTNVSNIWTVDNGTKKIYQYTAAASRTSGSQSAATTFALAVGNTNPQDIADPPVAGTQLPTENSVVSGSASVASAFVARSVTPVPVSILKRVTSELSRQDSSLRDRVTQSSDSTGLEGQISGLRWSKRTVRKQISSAHSHADHMASGDISTGADLDDLFADWSTDSLQLPLSNGR